MDTLLGDKPRVWRSQHLGSMTHVCKLKTGSHIFKALIWRLQFQSVLKFHAEMFSGSLFRLDDLSAKELLKFLTIEFEDSVCLETMAISSSDI